jgi:predicted transcriptional regulator
MAASISNLRPLGHSAEVRELDLASKLFHRINRIIPEDQAVLTIPPNFLVRDAVALMQKHGYSQLPVCKGKEVLGVFSLRSFAQEAAKVALEDLTKQKCTQGDLPVDDFMEQFEFARVTEEMSRVIDAIERDDAVLIGTPERLVGVLTAIDILRYLDRVASPFVLVSEIELALRALIRIALDSEQLAAAANRCLSSAYADAAKVPTTLEEMTFDNYQSLVAYTENWIRLEPVFGGTRIRVSGKLKEVGSIRNDLFHFKREITMRDHETLVGHRNWLLNKVKQADPHGKMEVQP